eukprot:GHVO01006529.1.p2 GENE.GHVO01006529.1~~GHVO01006529.1.p2  ORF type:complete len:121 (-),score=23.41 GHVO01006529.1:955-1317(-)
MSQFPYRCAPLSEAPQTTDCPAPPADDRAPFWILTFRDWTTLCAMNVCESYTSTAPLRSTIIAVVAFPDVSISSIIPFISQRWKVQNMSACWHLPPPHFSGLPQSCFVDPEMTSNFKTLK